MVEARLGEAVRWEGCAVTTDCEGCPLRRLPMFDPMTPAELAFMRGFKAGELVVAPDTTILMQGSASPQLFTVLKGWGIRHLLLPDGGRQVINFVMPGDMVGLQAGLLGKCNTPCSPSPG